jgi:phage replication-related protein YjqB (UPF0714/DUF867 family)
MLLIEKYRNFSDLQQNEVEGQDYRIRSREGTTGIAVVAPHGGRIERGTSQVTEAVAGEEHSFYCFEGMKPVLSTNKALHITSNCFDEPGALTLVSRAEKVMTIHGARGSEEAVYLGGLDLDFRTHLIESCRSAGFDVGDDPSPTRQGMAAMNICNRGITGKGLQVELTFGLRKQLFEPSTCGTKWNPNNRFWQLVRCLRDVLGGTAS